MSLIKNFAYLILSSAGLFVASSIPAHANTCENVRSVVWGQDWSYAAYHCMLIEHPEKKNNYHGMVWAGSAHVPYSDTGTKTYRGYTCIRQTQYPCVNKGSKIFTYSANGYNYWFVWAR